MSARALKPSPCGSAQSGIYRKDLHGTCKALSSRSKLYELENVPCDGLQSSSLIGPRRVDGVPSAKPMGLPSTASYRLRTTDRGITAHLSGISSVCSN